MKTTYSTQVMELLSLGTTSEGINQLKVAVAHEDSLAEYIIDIDEFTFHELELLRPLDGGRARLSPYPKWDPFRNTYYSAIVRTTGDSRYTMYFACSEEFIHLIKKIRNKELSPVPASVGEQGQGVRKGSRRLASSLRRLSASAPRVGLLLVMVGLLTVLSIPSTGNAVPVRALGEQVGIASAGGTKAESMADSMALKPVADLDPAGEAQEAVITPAKAAVITDQTAATPVKPASVKPSANQDKDKPGYEVIDIETEGKFFGLPKRYVALTFDDGPSALTDKIVDILTENKVAATFLFVGNNVGHHPEAVDYASKHGMSIGNHSWDHSVLTKATAKNQSDNLAKASSAIEAETGAPVTLFRPPYGAVNDALVAAAKKQDMKTLLWNRDPEDWNAKSPEDIVQYFHEVEAAGGIYVLHEDKNTVEALPEIIKYLKTKDLTFAIFK